MTPSATPVLSAPAPPFAGTTRKVTTQERGWMTGETWQKGCPLSIDRLRLLTVSYYNFEGAIQAGRVMVHRRVDAPMLAVFERLYDRQFPIEVLDTVELYPPDERPDNPRNVTAAFNCRKIAGSSTWSQHAYGLAIDINPVQNPWVSGKDVVPTAGKAYVDRSQDLPGMIHRGDATVHAFTSIGWGWGGKWNSLKDYMHFSLTGG